MEVFLQAKAEALEKLLKLKSGTQKGGFTTLQVRPGSSVAV